jgi:nitric oxide synthase oxygenase domain/subunit
MKKETTNPTYASYKSTNLVNYLNESGTGTLNEVLDLVEDSLEKEKKQIEVSFSDGQETPINHPTLPHYSREEYYNDFWK